MWPFDIKQKHAAKLALLNAIVPSLPPLCVVVMNGFKLYNPKTWGGPITQRLTTQRWTHVFTTARNGKYSYTTDFHFKMVETIPYLMDADEFAIYQIPGLTPEQVDIGVKTCQAEIGKAYPVVNLGAMFLDNFFHPGDNNLNFNHGAHVCSQFEGYLFDKMGVKLAPGLSKDYTFYFPGDCVDNPEKILQGSWIGGKATYPAS